MCVHCRWCQRESGAAFALNGLMEAEQIELLGGAVEVIDTPSESGSGQRIARCPVCRGALWSNDSGAGEALRFVRIGTLDDPDQAFRRTCASTRRRNNRGCSLMIPCPPSPATTGVSNTRRRKAWPGSDGPQPADCESGSYCGPETALTKAETRASASLISAAVYWPMPMRRCSSKP